MRAVRERAGRVARHRGGLAAFDQPRYLHIEQHPGADPHPVAELLQGQALLGRVLVAVVLVGAGPMLDRPDDVVTRFGWLVAFVWLPVVGLLDLAHRRWGGAWTVRLGLGWDVALFAAMESVLHTPAAAAVGYLVITAYHAYVGGKEGAATALSLTAACAIVVPGLRGDPRDLHLLAAELCGLGLMAWLLADAAHRMDRSRAGIVQVSEKAAAILAGIADAVVVTSPRGRIHEWNPAATRTFDRSVREAVGGRCAEVLGLQGTVRPLSCDDGCPLLADGASGGSVEVWRRDGTGRRQPLLASVSPVVGEDGMPLEVIHSFRDITALKAADEAKTTFLATASHELRTPLTVIQGFAQVLRREGYPEDQRHQGLEAIERRTLQLAGIVDRLLMSSRIDAGRIQLSLSLIELDLLLDERVASLQAATGRLVELRAPTELPSVLADRDAIATVIDHLLDNAVKYSPDGGPVEVTAATAGDHVVVQVTDAGIGMTAEQAAHCFERFWQAEHTETRRFGGTGIGLYIVRSLVEAMHATITVRSHIGEGTTFELLLRTSAPAPDPAEAGEAEPMGDGQTSMIREYMRQVGVPMQHAGERR